MTINPFETLSTILALLLGESTTTVELGPVKLEKILSGKNEAGRSSVTIGKVKPELLPRRTFVELPEREEDPSFYAPVFRKSASIKYQPLALIMDEVSLQVSAQRPFKGVHAQNLTETLSARSEMDEPPRTMPAVKRVSESVEGGVVSIVSPLFVPSYEKPERKEETQEEIFVSYFPTPETKEPAPVYERQTLGFSRESYVITIQPLKMVDEPEICQNHELTAVTHTDTSVEGKRPQNSKGKEGFAEVDEPLEIVEVNQEPSLNFLALKKENEALKKELEENKSQQNMGWGKSDNQSRVPPAPPPPGVPMAPPPPPPPGAKAPVVQEDDSPFGAVLAQLKSGKVKLKSKDEQKALAEAPVVKEVAVLSPVSAKTKEIGEKEETLQSLEAQKETKKQERFSIESKLAGNLGKKEQADLEERYQLAGEKVRQLEKELKEGEVLLVRARDQLRAQKKWKELAEKNKAKREALLQSNGDKGAENQSLLGKSPQKKGKKKKSVLGKRQDRLQEILE